MSSPGVSSLLRDILLIFAEGMDVLVRPRAKKPRKRRDSPRLTQEELQLHDSLQNRPREIKAEYAQSIVKHGKRFEHGDQKAYSDLAQTLLILNTGLINLINQTSSSDIADLSKSRQNLLLLSESAATSTKRALSHLDTRLTIELEPGPTQVTKRSDHRPSKKQQGVSSPSRPGPSPLLARGGWVRSKSGSSVISATTARKLAARGGRDQRSKSSPGQALKRNSSGCTTDSPVVLTGTQEQDQTCSYHSSPKFSENKWTRTATKEMTLPDFDRAPSMIIVPAEYFDNTYQPSDRACSPPPPRPPKILPHARSNPRLRPRPISGATFMTASTKIGEIPKRNWPDRVLSEEEQDEHENLPLPYVIPPPLTSPEKPSRGFRFWKKIGMR